MSARRRNAPLGRRPGFLVRRLHQIFLSIYFRDCEEFGTTPVQSSVMQVLLSRPGIDQVSLAAEIGTDRTTMSNVLRRLETREFVRREIDPADRRNKKAFLTSDGDAMIKSMFTTIDEAHEQLLRPLTRDERVDFMRMLHKLVEANNDLGRAALARV